MNLVMTISEDKYLKKSIIERLVKNQIMIETPNRYRKYKDIDTNGKIVYG